ncbi:MAG: RluA family pseudouridine synthase, partial [Planctomycetaceae bacterium]|nr:RluA family pseudouridine synthase [Planctomycetaceae bacterium]
MNDVPLSADESPVYEFLVEHELSGVRIDSFLAKHLRNYTTWKLARMIGAGAGAINDVPASPADRVFTGQCVRVRLFEPPDKLLDALQTPLEILYEDHWMAVVNKPAGMVVHPTGELQGTSLANALQSHLDERCAPRGILRPGIVHRLDRQTSGAIVVAFTHNAHAALSSAFEQSRVAKQYMALVHGRVRQDQGTIDWPIGRTNTGRHVLMSCRADALDRKPAKTYYEVIERYADHTLVLAKPRTGRNHQIRVHFAHLGHPLLGDEFYEAHGRLRPFDGGF